MLGKIREKERIATNNYMESELSDSGRPSWQRVANDA